VGIDYATPRNLNEKERQMGTRSKGKLITKEVTRIKHVDGKEVKYQDVIQYRGKNKRKQMMKRLEEKIPAYENPYRIPRSKRATHN
jgi:hypothetical protein